MTAPAPAPATASRRVGRTSQPEHSMTGVSQQTNQRPADCAGRARQQDSHRSPLTSFRACAFVAHWRMLPQLDAAEQALRIAHHLDVRRQLEVDRRRIAAADVQPVVVERLAPARQSLRAGACSTSSCPSSETRGCRVRLRRSCLVERMMAELEMNPMSVDEEHRSESGAEGDDQLVALARDASEALHVGVVGDSHGSLELLLQRRLKREIFPSFAEIRRRVHDAVL